MIPTTPNKRECVYIYINYNFWQRLTKVPQLRIELSCDAKRAYFLIQFNERKKKKNARVSNTGFGMGSSFIGSPTYIRLNNLNCSISSFN